MIIKIPFGDKFVECDTLEGAEKMIALIKKQEDEEKIKRAAAGLGGSEVEKFFSGIFGADESAWTPQVFTAFIERLGHDQQAILRLLVTKRRVTDDELRAALEVDNNQALAGVLSGISKQAAALNIVARAVFGIENRRRAGELTKIYFVADEFRKISDAQHWPDLSEK